MVAAGASPYALAAALDHSDLQNVGVYFDVHSDIVEHLDKAMAMVLTDRAAKFAKIVECEGDAINGGRPGSRRYVSDRERNLHEPIGTCGHTSFCNVVAPYACYTCPKFQAWLDGPHELVLDKLIESRAEREQMGLDPRFVSVEDQLIIHVAEPIIHCGIRYWVEKVQRWDIKWLPTVMVPVAKEAIETIISLTQSARDLARWYEEHPGQAWLPGPDRGPFQEYTMEDVATMFGLAGKGGARQWLIHRKIPINRDRTQHTVYRSNLEPALLKAWNKYNYLEKGSGNIRRSNLLFLTFANQHNFRNTNSCCIAPTTDQHISDFLSGRGDEESGKIQSIFERFDSVDTHGNPFRMNSHQFRHWMNTIAQRGALSELLVARWSGRKEVSQNSVYDHVGPLELAEKARNLMAGGHVLGSLAEVHTRKLSRLRRAAKAEAPFHFWH